MARLMQLRSAGWTAFVVLSVAVVAPAMAVSTLLVQVRGPASQPAPSAPANAPANDVCLDAIFYAALPGQTNYCLGLRDWNAGHFETGLEFLQLAAGWGNKNAQYTLGLIYFSGHHVAVDPALGLAWLELADQRHNDPQITLAMKSADHWATPAQRARARDLYAAMSPKYGDAVAATRAWQHWLHWWHGAANNKGLVCLSGRQLWTVQHAGIDGMAPQVTDALQAAAASAGRKHTPRCFGISLKQRRHLVRESGGAYFAGWAGIVSVGPLKQVPAPATSAGR